jgi:hypothetical protein
MSPLPHDLFTLDQLNRFGSELVAQTNARIPRRDPVDHGVAGQGAVEGGETEAVRQTAGRGKMRLTPPAVSMLAHNRLWSRLTNSTRSHSPLSACRTCRPIRSIG